MYELLHVAVKMYINYSFFYIYDNIIVFCIGMIERKRIKEALSYWEEQSCVTFTENARSPFKLVFVKQSGQVSSIDQLGLHDVYCTFSLLYFNTLVLSTAVTVLVSLTCLLVDINIVDVRRYMMNVCRACNKKAELSQR